MRGSVGLRWSPGGSRQTRSCPRNRQPISLTRSRRPLIQEIETDDGLLNYGKFEKTAPAKAQLLPSPADAAIQKVKRKLIQKSEAEKNQMLDWID